MAAGPEMPALGGFPLLPLVNLSWPFCVAGLVVIAIGENPWRRSAAGAGGRRSIRRGAGAHALLRHQFHLHRPRRGGRLPRRPVQHRRRGPGQYRRPRRGAGLPRRSTWTPWLVVPLAMVAAALFGAAWAFIPGYLQARRGSHVVITTIMFNFIASALMIYLLVNVLIKPGQRRRSRDFGRRRLPFGAGDAGWFGISVATLAAQSVVAAGAALLRLRLALHLAHPLRLCDPHRRRTASAPPAMPASRRPAPSSWPWSSPARWRASSASTRSWACSTTACWTSPPATASSASPWR